jgi:O-antigen/teichoic acid export membrane protein
MSREAQRQRDHAKLVRGVGLNFLGSLGRALVPAFYVLANRLYGAEALGLYALAISPTEILGQFVVTGFADAIQRFGARDADTHEASDRHYAVLWRCLVWVAGASALAVAVVAIAGPWIARVAWGRPELGRALVLFAVNVPIVGVMSVWLAAARAVMDMRGDALVRGLVNPVVLIVAAAAVHRVAPGVVGLGLALTISNVVGLIAAGWYFSRHYSLARLVAARRSPAPPGLLGFAVPQSVNMALWQALWSIDVLMLGHWVGDAALGLYRTATEVARVVFSIRLSFSSVYAPLVARYTLEQDHRGLQESYTRLSRWISMIAAPVVVLVAIHQREVLWVFNPLYGHGAAFLWVLLVGPLVACATGLTGNILVMTGHHLWNLGNSALALVLNVALNAALIPGHGMWGAAVATMTATTVVCAAQIVQAWWLLGVRLELAQLAPPFLAAALGGGAVWLAGARLPHVMAGVAFVLLYGIALVGLERVRARERVAGA